MATARPILSINYCQINYLIEPGVRVRADWGLNVVPIHTAEVYEYSVLVTSLKEELVSLGQLYRDRGESENMFDELKNN